MFHFRRLITSALAIFLIMACAFLMPPTSVATIIPTSVATANSTFTPIAASIPTSSPAPTDSIPAFASFQPVTLVTLASSERVHDMVTESDGTIWLLTDHRVMQYSQGTWRDYLSSFKGAIIGMDSNHRVWVVSDDHNQVSVWDGSAWANLGSEADWETLLPDNGMGMDWSLAMDTSGHVWLATDRDVRMFDGTKWRVFSLDSLGMPLPEDADTLSETTLVFLKKSGYVWAINCHWIGPGPFGGEGARWYDGYVWQGTDSPVAHGCATVVNEDSLGNIWLGLDNNLWRLDSLSGNWEQFPAPEPPEDAWFGFFDNLALDAVGNPWVELVLCGGASCYTSNIQYHFTGAEWLQIGNTGFDDSSLYFDAAGQGWVFTPNSIFRITKNQLELVTDLSILKVAVTPSGKLWIMGTYEGEIVLWSQALDG